MTITITSDSPIPVLARTEALIVEGTLAGSIAAFTLAKDGRKTTLVASGCSIPHEMCVCRRAWLKETDLAELPEEFQHAFQESVSETTEDEELLLNLAQLAMRVEDILIEADVQLFYGMKACGVIRAGEETLTGVVFSGKFGLQAVRADAIVDGTHSAQIPTLAGQTVKIRETAGDSLVVTVISKANVTEDDVPFAVKEGKETDGGSRPQHVCPTAIPAERKLSVTGETALRDGLIPLHGPFAEFNFRLPFDFQNPCWQAHLSTATREALIRTGTMVTSQRKAEGKRPLVFHRFSGDILVEPVFRISPVSPEEPGRPLGLANVWVCGPAAATDVSQDSQPFDPFRCAGLARRATTGVLREMRTADPSGSTVTLSGDTDGRADARAEFRFTDQKPLHSEDETIEIAEQSLPVLDACDVLVVGGGTSGAPAALSAAQSGASVVLIEQHCDVGGTKTTGGVCTYWFGRETPCQKSLDDAFNALSQQSGMAREIAMMKCLLDAGVIVLAPCSIAGVACEGTRVPGVVVSTDRGLAIVQGKIIIDATGDADLAAWAGFAYDYGNGRDAWTMWASFANFNAERHAASRQYESAIEIRDPHDFMRTVVTGRRRQGMWRRLEHDMPQLYATPRESRRVKADEQVTYRGILATETFEDVMFVCESNFDIKGIASSDLICCGVVWSWKTHTNYLAAVPWRAILPEGSENLIVAGRAYSITHDALSLARMQRDMASMGAGAGIAAARAAKTDILPAKLDVGALQAEWVRRGTLREEDLHRFGSQRASYSKADAERDAQAILDGDCTPQRLAGLATSPESIGPLNRAYESAKDKSVRTQIARVLCYLGQAKGVPFLLDEIAEQIQDGLPQPQQQTISTPPEHGWAPEPVYSLFAIGLAGRGQDAVSLMEAIARAVEDSADSFSDRTTSPFEYIRAICSVAERCPGSAMLGPLELLLKKQCLTGLAIQYSDDPRRAVDPVLERRSYLELCLGRALARCADRRGYKVLLRYAGDLRGGFARSARDELYELLNCTGPQNQKTFSKTIGQLAEPLQPRPFRKRIE